MELEHQEREPEENIFRRNRAGLMEKQSDGSFVGINVSPDAARPSASMKAVVRGRELNLREAYDRYKDNKGLGRADMIGLLVGVIETLQDRIGAVDEAAVAALAKRIEALETVIGNALATRAPAVDSEAPRKPPKEPSFYDIVSARVSGWLEANSPLSEPPAGWQWSDPVAMDYARVARIALDHEESRSSFYVAFRVDCADEEMDAALRDLLARIPRDAPKRGPGRPAKVKEAGNG